MKYIYTSPLCGQDESAELVYVYELENDEEVLDFEEMSFEEKCDLFGLRKALVERGLSQVLFVS